ncbi:hypothetical protein Moror_16621 [Moniliophthora roreri MCA 2997]|uniref:Uncharacterized protein n=1 Tax=Moniliophthora roreri (strain MCA 2997) TaxID=1381753 RepID=V2Y3Q0_MONRO|nr:hypothetical protein Moror_16621 [Moniliophthora roreri MCA 2997]
MSANASSSTQQSADSYKTAEEYPASTIPDLSGYVPIVKFLAEVAEPEYSPLPVCKPGESTTLYSAHMRVASAAQSRLEADWLAALEAREEQLADWKQWCITYKKIENG